MRSSGCRQRACEICRAGYQSACLNRVPMGSLGAQAELLRVPLADGTLVATPEVPDNDLIPSLLSASDVLGTGWFGAVAAEAGLGKTVAVVGDGAVGLLAVLAAKQLGAERVIAIDRFPERLCLAEQDGGAEALNYEQVNVLEALEEITGGRGPDACIDAVGLEAHTHGPIHVYDRLKQATMMQTDRPHALREAILACRKGGHVSVPGVYGGFIDKFPMGAVVNKALTIKSGQTHVQRYL